MWILVDIQPPKKRWGGDRYASSSMTHFVKRLSLSSASCVLLVAQTELNSDLIVHAMVRCMLPVNC